MPRTIRIGQKGFHRRADPCHKAPARASAPQRAARSKMAGIRAIRPRPRSFCVSYGPIRAPIAPPRACKPLTSWIAISSLPVISFDRGATFNGSMMTDDKQGREPQPGGAGKKDARQARLKLALRENLKRRKSQTRGRGEVAKQVMTAHRIDLTKRSRVHDLISFTRMIFACAFDVCPSEDQFQFFPSLISQEKAKWRAILPN